MGPQQATAGDLQTARIEAHGHAVEMVVDPADHIGRKLAGGDFYERDLLEDARQRMRRGTVIDVGAHVGNHTVWFGAVCGARVVSLEPNPDSFALLVDNVRRNRIRGWLANVAVGSELAEGRVVSVNPLNTGMTVIAKGRGGVRIVTVDSLGARNVSLLKVDVEGSELEALEGAEETIKASRPLIYVEAASQDSKRGVDRFLRRFGYSRFGRFCATPTYGYAA